ncbi:MAG: AI-2E family transporter [Mycobacteriales bacterium]
MAPTGDVPRLRVSNRSVIIAAIAFAVTLLAMRILAAAGRVIGWMLVAAAIAGLLAPLVAQLSRRMRRGAAAILVMLLTVAIGGFVVRGLVTDVLSETEKLKVSAAEAARELEEGHGGFADFASSIRLEERTERFMELVPEQLSGGGTAAEKLRANATRGVAFLATFILSLFLLLHGPKIAAAAAEQIGDRDQRMRVRRVGVSAFRRAFGYARGTIAQSIFAGTLAYLLARVVGIPGAGALAVWVAIWDIVPVAGAAIGALPLVVLGFLEKPLYGVLLAVAFIAVQVLEDVVWQPRLERQTMKLGPFLTVFFGLVGLELRGLTGALLSILFGALLIAVIDDFAPEAAPPDPRDAALMDPEEPSPGDMEPPGGRVDSGQPQTA